MLLLQKQFFRIWTHSNALTLLVLLFSETYFILFFFCLFFSFSNVNSFWNLADVCLLYLVPMCFFSRVIFLNVIFIFSYWVQYLYKPSAVLESSPAQCLCFVSCLCNKTMWLKTQEKDSKWTLSLDCFTGRGNEYGYNLLGLFFHCLHITTLSE